MSIILVLYAAAFIITLISAVSGRVPLWIAVLLVTIGLILQTYGGR